MTDDAISIRSRRLHRQAVDFERRIAVAAVAKDGPELAAIAREIDAALAHGHVATGCDVAMTMMSTAAQVLANPDTSLARKREWADSDGDYVVGSIATFMASCEDDAGVPHSRRVLTAELLKAY